MRTPSSYSSVLFFLSGLLFLQTLLLIVRAADDDEETGYEGKELPEKGDSECPSLAERYEMLNGKGDPTAWLTFCDTDDSTPPAVVEENGIVLQFFASLPAFSSAFGKSSQWKKHSVYYFT